MGYMIGLGEKAKAAQFTVTALSTKQKNAILSTLAELLAKSKKTILKANDKDIACADENGVASHMIDRLRLTNDRINDMIVGINQIIALPDPIGQILSGGPLENGLSVVKKRVPLGVIGIIYESRPNVTIDAAALCIKTGNVTILRGGSDAINSNKALTKLIRKALTENGVPADMVQLVENTSRETATELMKLNGYVDVLIPRGGKGLINSVVKNATVPVIETGAGNCHVFIDESADLEMALKITDNAKTQRPSVCNSIESLLVHEEIAPIFLHALKASWRNKVKLLGDDETKKIIEIDGIATEEDYATEFNDFIISIKIVKNLEEAIAHINKYSTRHSECIVTKNFENADIFQQKVDAAAVYVNTSTRFTDGFEMGLGAEIGISTQKLHARGPMGLEELTSYKYLINSNGLIRG